MVPAIELLWPTFLIFTHFFTCGFYPWVTASSVLYMHSPFTISMIGRKCLNISWPLLLGDTDLQWRFPSRRHIDSVKDRLTSSITDIGITLVTKVKHLLRKFKKAVVEKVSPIAWSQKDTRPKKVVDSKGPDPSDRNLGPPPSGDASTEKSSPRRVTPKRKSKKIPPKDSAKDARRMRMRTTVGISGYKMGYCGRCWRVNNLPFRPGFSGLRQPYTTRCGTAYGPTRYFLTTDQFIGQYGIGKPVI